MGGTGPGLLSFEVDTFWVEHGGLNAWQFIQEHAARITHIHAKELRKSDNADVAAGQGNVDFKRIVPLARMTALTPHVSHSHLSF
jgi:sugar phosphate isomerase/epimerase